MILGTGSDLTDITRIEKLIARFGDRFIKRVFTPYEIEAAQSRQKNGAHIATYAKRFAAKEACAKALGTGIARGVHLKDIGVENDDLGRPTLVLTGGALTYLNKLVPSGKTAHIHLTLSDEPPLAMAHIIIEAV